MIKNFYYISKMKELFSQMNNFEDISDNKSYIFKYNNDKKYILDVIIGGGVVIISVTNNNNEKIIKSKWIEYKNIKTFDKLICKIDYYLKRYRKYVDIKNK